MSFPRDTVASFGAMSLGSSGGGRRGGGDKRGGGKKPGGSGRMDVPLASPKKTRSPIAVVLDILTPYLNLPANGDLANRFANELGRYLTNNPGFRFPAFIHDIAVAHQAYQQGHGSQNDAFFIHPNADNPEGVTLFRYLYRRSRNYIRDNDDALVEPGDLDLLGDMQDFHTRAIQHGIDSGGTVGPYGPYVAGWLLYFANGAQHYLNDPNRPSSPVACGCCTARPQGWRCTQVQDNNNCLILLGRCLVCWIFNRPGCSFLVARGIAAHQAAIQSGQATAQSNIMSPSSLSKKDAFNTGRALYRKTFPSNALFSPSGPMRAGLSTPSSTLAREANDLTPSVRRSPRRHPQSGSNAPLGAPSGPASFPTPLTFQQRQAAARANHQAIAQRMRADSQRPPSSFAVPSRQEIALAVLARLNDRQPGAPSPPELDNWNETESLPSPPPGGGLGPYERSTTYSPTRTIGLSSPQESFEDAMEEVLPALDDYSSPLAPASPSSPRQPSSPSPRQPGSPVPPPAQPQSPPRMRHLEGPSPSANALSSNPFGSPRRNESLNLDFYTFPTGSPPRTPSSRRPNDPSLGRTPGAYPSNPSPRRGQSSLGLAKSIEEPSMSPRKGKDEDKDKGSK
ncbi:hypothetical protein AA0113_g12732 [Alternaria arborescens]|uniref:Uncharacterized protein n=1 Tax=Alternaria arborescens TaxID=156630 RepID=A0A4Q4PW65_9PLEO|nr:hypothetical protein AA0113_g12732 [Alternaria arborescens]